MPVLRHSAGSTLSWARKAQQYIHPCLPSRSSQSRHGEGGAGTARWTHGPNSRRQRGEMRAGETATPPQANCIVPHRCHCSRCRCKTQLRGWSSGARQQPAPHSGCSLHPQETHFHCANYCTLRVCGPAAYPNQQGQLLHSY